MKLEKINGIAPSQDKDSQVKNSEKSKLDKAGEGAMFPGLSVFTNEKASEFMKGMNEKETTYNLFDDETGELSTDLKDWEEAFVDNEYNLALNSDAKRYIEKEYDEERGIVRFKYNSDGEGKKEKEFETKITFYDIDKPQYTVNNGEVTMGYAQDQLKKDENNEWIYVNSVSFEYKDERGIHGFKESENPIPIDKEQIPEKYGVSEIYKNRIRSYSISGSNNQTESETIIYYDKNGKAIN